MKVFLKMVGLCLFITACNQQTKQSKELEHDKMDHGMENVLMKSMGADMAKMHSVKLTGNPDYDFATMMIPHHQAAISMSEALLKQSKNPSFKAFATHVVEAQEKEVAELENFLKTANKTPISQAKVFSKAMQATMGVMMKSMSEIKSTGNLDKDYAVLMIPHHQSAIDMAKVYLLYAKNVEVKKLAEDIINAQEKEIGWLKKQ